jgi:sugar-phosphatase
VLESAQIPYREMAYVTGSDVRKKKPDPELFVTAARQIELPPQRCIVIEDAPDGILAAHSAGCCCIAVTNSVAAGKLLDADLVVKSLVEVQVETIVQLVASKDR